MLDDYVDKGSSHYSKGKQLRLWIYSARFEIVFNDTKKHYFQNIYCSCITNRYLQIQAIEYIYPSDCQFSCNSKLVDVNTKSLYEP